MTRDPSREDSDIGAASAVETGEDVTFGDTEQDLALSASAYKKGFEAGQKHLAGLISKMVEARIGECRQEPIAPDARTRAVDVILQLELDVTWQSAEVAETKAHAAYLLRA